MLGAMPTCPGAWTPLRHDSHGKPVLASDGNNTSIKISTGADTQPMHPVRHAHLSCTTDPATAWHDSLNFNTPSQRARESDLRDLTKPQHECVPNEGQPRQGFVQDVRRVAVWDDMLEGDPVALILKHVMQEAQADALILLQLLEILTPALVDAALSNQRITEHDA